MKEIVSKLDKGRKKDDKDAMTDFFFKRETERENRRCPETFLR